ncbi:GLPGLI family protein [Formosa haliotis]|uniref:GLPGLI family protein n=1 Tax=Formosa haliotis TaxID=1555194 RepID=UPI0008259494|nr:GLPGLI family protein [Formosa haliotis]
MKQLLRLSIIFMSTLVFAQNKTGLVNYGHKQSMGMGAPIGLDYNAALQFNTDYALYSFQKDALEGGHIQKSEIIRDGENKVFVKSKFSTPEGFQYYTDRNTNTMQSRDLGLVYVKETLPKITWEISSETKTIGDFNCVKATTSFRGRDYTAWFTTAIPLPYGPWKLQGLPGLILEAYDTHKEVYFYFKSIQYPLATATAIVAPNPKQDGKAWITFADYKNGLIEAHKRATENGRLFMENFDAEENTARKSMANTYVEVFDE